ncbi:MAG: AEC family transporter [Desulfobacteraceae bacterium]|jgi:predicted permease
MVVNNLFPVFAIIILGALLKKTNLTNDAFLATSDRLIYYIFFPALLFWKIGASAQTFSPESLRFYGAALAAIGILYVLSTLFIIIYKVPDFQAGTFSQSCYRFNTYIGMAVILTAWGEPGMAQFGVLIGAAIPIINVMAVTTLIWFSDQSLARSKRLRLTFAALGTNPLILACATGIVYAHWINSFPIFVENTLKLGATITLPLALLSIGGTLTLGNLKRYLSLAMVGATFKLIILPAIGWFMMQLLNVAPVFYPVGMLFFALPTSTAIFVLSAQLNSDTELAAAAVVLSTGLSFFSMSLVLWYFNG